MSLLFEPTPELTSLLIPLIHTHNPPTYHSLSQLALSKLSSLPPTSPLLHAILAAHPRLGAKKVDSEHSQAEQKSLGSDVEREQLRELNEEYERRFPGLRYVVFVNGRSREVVMGDMRERIEGGTMESEVRKASEAMCDIAVDRAKKLGQE